MFNHWNYRMQIRIKQSWKICKIFLFTTYNIKCCYCFRFNKIRVFDIPLQQNVKRMNRLTPRRGDPFAFGLGKRAQDPFAFGLGKRSYYWRDTEKRDPYAFGLGK